MTLEEILQDVDSLVSNSIQPGIKVRWCSQIQRQVYRELPIEEDVYPFLTKVGYQVYEVPADCQLDNIKSVVIGGREYEEAHPDEADPPKYFWSVTSNTFMISPAPDEVMNGFIRYKPTPVDFSETNLNVTPKLPEDFHQLYVDGCAARVAKAEKDFQAARVYEDSFAELLDKAIRTINPFEVFTIKLKEW